MLDSTITDVKHLANDDDEHEVNYMSGEIELTISTRDLKPEEEKQKQPLPPPSQKKKKKKTKKKNIG